MNIDDLTSNMGAWLGGQGPHANVVISSRIRLARNVAQRPFLSTASPSQRREIYDLLSTVVARLYPINTALFIDVDKASALDRQLLVERHLISHHHAVSEGSRGVSVSHDESAALMINEEDHLRVQVLSDGLRLEQLWTKINAIDDKLSERIPFAFDNQLGYLTVCPTNVGTGIRVSVMMHLPALKWTKEIERVERATRDMRLAVRGQYGEGTDVVGDLYQISNQTTLGSSEEEIVEVFNNKIIPHIVEYEYAARETLIKHSLAQFEDKVWRAYGLLANARCISTQEMQTLLSPIRMAIQMDRFDAIDLQTLNHIFLHTQSAHLQKRAGTTMNGSERAVARADYIRQQLSS